MTKLIRFKLPALWNSEYPLVVKRIISTARLYNLEDLRLLPVYNRLKAFETQLEKIELQERSGGIESSNLSETDEHRDTHFNIICNVSKAFNRTTIGDIRAAANLIQKAVRKHGTDIAKANYTSATQRFYELIADMEGQPEMVKALEKLSLMPIFQQLKEGNQRFETLFMQRIREQAEVEKINIRAIRNDCDKAITLFSNAIEYNIAEYGEAEYIPLVTALNILNSYYKDQLAIRSARRKERDKEESVSKEKNIVTPDIIVYNE